MFKNDKKIVHIIAIAVIKIIVLIKDYNHDVIKYVGRVDYSKQNVLC